MEEIGRKHPIHSCDSKLNNLKVNIDRALYLQILLANSLIEIQKMV